MANNFKIVVEQLGEFEIIFEISLAPERWTVERIFLKKGPEIQ
jgi:hypothetical protein